MTMRGYTINIAQLPMRHSECKREIFRICGDVSHGPRGGEIFVTDEDFRKLIQSNVFRGDVCLDCILSGLDTIKVDGMGAGIYISKLIDEEENKLFTEQRRLSDELALLERELYEVERKPHPDQRDIDRLQHERSNIWDQLMDLASETNENKLEIACATLRGILLTQ